MQPEIIIRTELDEDKSFIEDINVSAFASDEEAQLVNELRHCECEYLSLVAEIENKVVGYILFTPVTLAGHAELKLAGLAPMAVLPAYQNRGIGSALVRQGIALCKQQGFQAVIVLGHASYYPRFGFKPAKEYGIESEYDVPAEAFMILQLAPGCLDDKSGVIRYHRLFGTTH